MRYGEALLKNGDKDEAIKNYRKSLIINPDSNTVMMNTILFFIIVNQYL